MTKFSFKALENITLNVRNDLASLLRNLLNTKPVQKKTEGRFFLQKPKKSMIFQDFLIFNEKVEKINNKKSSVLREIVRQ